MKRFLFAFWMFLLPIAIFAQSLSNPIAMHKDSSAFIGWATSAEIVRGYVKISDTTFTYTDIPSGVTSNHAFYGTTSDCLGQANGQYISLGDGGIITLQFDIPIANGEGHDFAVFENALIPNAVPNQDSIVFYELAFVEVSSNGEDFVRFPAVSHVQTDVQVGSFGYENSNLLTNLAGIFPVFYGYPFDLEELANEPNLDVNNITHVRLIDVVGSIDPEYGTFDSEGNIINDPYPTPFHSCGFDLDAVGVIHFRTHTITASATENGSINPSGEFTVYAGSSMDFTITPNEGYRIGNVIVDAGTENEIDVIDELVDGVYTFRNINADHTIMATFIPIVHIEIITNEGGDIETNGNDYVDYGGDYTFQVVPDNCHQITSVTVNGEDVEPENNSYTIQNVTEPQTINVTFGIITYNITISDTENGAIAPNGENGIVEVNCGEDKTFTITPDSGFMIHSVLVDGDSVGTMSSYTFQNITNNHTFGAIFDPIPEGQVIVVVNANEGGNVSSLGTQAVDHGTDFSFTATPDDCYEVVSATVNGNEVELTNGSYTIENVTEDITIDVTFGLINYNIAVSTGEHGTISPEGENGIVAVVCGNDITFTITADEQYRIESVFVDDEDITDSLEDGVYTFENVRDNHSLSVTFIEEDAVEEIMSAPVAVFPNPNNGIFNIDFGGFEGNANFQLIDVRGIVIDSRDINVSDGEMMNLDYNLRQGAYFVRIITADKVYVEQFIVE